MKALIINKFHSNPFLNDLAQQGLINIQGLAEQFKSEIFNDTGEDLSANAIAMCIRRYLKSQSGNKTTDWKFPEDIEITSRSEIYEVAVERSQKNIDLFLSLQKNASHNKGNFLSVFEGSYEVVILTNQKNKPEIRKHLKASQITSEVDNLGYVTVNWEKLTKDIPGIYYRINKSLAVNDISIQSFHTIGTEMMILFKEDKLSKAYEIICKLF